MATELAPIVNAPPPPDGAPPWLVLGAMRPPTLRQAPLAPEVEAGGSWLGPFPLLTRRVALQEGVVAGDYLGPP